jgi:hypothetical protein
MKERIYDVIKWGLVIIIAAAAFYMTNRYIIVTNAQGIAYKMDKMTGQVWLVTVNTVRVIKEER